MEGGDCVDPEDNASAALDANNPANFS